MQKLQITEDLRKELQDKCIVVCTHTLSDGTEIDCIEIDYQSQYPQLNIVEVFSSKAIIGDNVIKAPTTKFRVVKL